MTLYDKYLQQKEKYCSVFKAMKILYDKNKNSITYIDGNKNMLSVQYSKDMNNIEQIFAKHDNESKWKRYTKSLENLGSEIWYYDFSSGLANPYYEVYPLHLCSLEEQGLFDVIMEIANDYIKQKDMPVILGIKYDGFGYAGTPVAIARKISDGFKYKEHPYDENVLYTKKFIESQLEKETSSYFEQVIECRNKMGRNNYLDEIYKKTEALGIEER